MTATSALSRATLRRVLAHGLTVGAVGLVAVPTATAAVVTAIDVVKRRGRKKRPAQQPGTFHAEAGESQLSVFTSGEALFDAMIEAIDGARESVKLETFIWKDDETGKRFVEAVNRAAERGVDVWVSYDGFANLVVDPRFYRSFAPGVRVYRLPAFTRPYWRGIVRYTGFNHSKILVVDGEVGFVGGFNIGDDYAHHWRDTHVRQVGPAVWGLDHSIATVWNAAHRSMAKMDWTKPVSWNQAVTVESNLPIQLVYPIRRVYLKAIERAQSRIYINTPYFIPDQQILQALKDASRRGVDVQVMLPKDSNHVVADWVSRGFFGEMLDAGVTILLYKASMIHAKTATVDGVWATVGTANIDRLSLGFNYETNLSVVGEDFAARMEEVFASDAAHCDVVTSPAWAGRHGMARVIETALVPLRPLL